MIWLPTQGNDSYDEDSNRNHARALEPAGRWPLSVVSAQVVAPRVSACTRSEPRLHRFIEWIHDEYGAPRTQSSNQADLAEFDVLKRHYGIAAPDLCGDWFMDLPLIRCTMVELAQREQHLHKLIPIAARMGANRIVLPLVDQPKITTEDEKQVVIDVLQRALPIAQSHHVELHLEADFNPID
jgi:hypothetical protein